MALWKYGAAICAYTILPVAAHGQDSFPVVDWGPMIQTEAMNSVMADAAGAGANGTKPVAQARPNARTSARTRANCAKVRTWVADGVRDRRVPALAAKCAQLGY